MEQHQQQPDPSQPSATGYHPAPVTPMLTSQPVHESPFSPTFTYEPAHVICQWPFPEILSTYAPTRSPVEVVPIDASTPSYQTIGPQDANTHDKMSAPLAAASSESPAKNKGNPNQPRDSTGRFKSRGEGSRRPVSIAPRPSKRQKSSTSVQSSIETYATSDHLIAIAEASLRMMKDIKADKKDGAHQTDDQSPVAETLTMFRKTLSNLQSQYTDEHVFCQSHAPQAYTRVGAAKSELYRTCPGGEHFRAASSKEFELFNVYMAEPLSDWAAQLTQEIQDLRAEGSRLGCALDPAEYMRRSDELDKQRQEIRDCVGADGPNGQFSDFMGLRPCYTKKGKEIAAVLQVVEEAVKRMEALQDRPIAGIELKRSE